MEGTDQNWQIRPADFSDPQLITLLRDHIAAAEEISPRDSLYALDIDALQSPDISLWAIFLDDMLAGCGALKILPGSHAEIKSMRTHTYFLRRGVASRVLENLVSEARRKGVRLLSLETGTTPEYDAAIALYKKFGFVSCPPFADYVESDFNQYFQLALSPASAQ